MAPRARARSRCFGRMMHVERVGEAVDLTPHPCGRRGKRMSVRNVRSSSRTGCSPGGDPASWIVVCFVLVQ